ncbi:MAG: citramalate synthase [Elusimicrobia bacterium]|nr:citramalate synthase [Elusimicrobiota bacterium]
MNKEIYIYDTTLRDGSQAEGISFTVKDKISVARALRELGIPYIEGGWPGSNPKDAEFFKRIKKIKLSPSKLVAFGSTRRKNIPAYKDKNLQELIKSKPDAFCIFGKTSLTHVKDALRTTPEENLRMIKSSVNFLKKRGKKEVIYDAEHFFDGYFENSEYALKTLSAALDGGADWIVLADTNGGTMPDDIARITKTIKEKFPHAKVGIHAHNDCELAVANSLSAVDNGATMVQGTINGWGERCGNANLSSIIPNLMLKKKLKIKNFTLKNLKKLTKISRYVDEVANLIPKREQPYVGISAFAHKGGVHVSAVMRNPSTYEHVDPRIVGNERRILISELSGLSNLKLKSEQLGIKLKDRELALQILREIKEREARGYQYEAADASLKLFLKLKTGKIPEFFNVKSCRVILEYLKKPSLPAIEKRCEASIKLSVKGQIVYEVAEGDGPVNALDNTLRKSLTKFYPFLNEMTLTDFRVRVLNPKEATAAAVRVFIESRDRDERWTTVGVSEDIIQASWNALIESFIYKLLKSHK